MKTHDRAKPSASKRRKRRAAKISPSAGNAPKKCEPTNRKREISRRPVVKAGARRPAAKSLNCKTEAMPLWLGVAHSEDKIPISGGTQKLMNEGKTTSKLGDAPRTFR